MFSKREWRWDGHLSILSEGNGNGHLSQLSKGGWGCHWLIKEIIDFNEKLSDF